MYLSLNSTASFEVLAKGRISIQLNSTCCMMTWTELSFYTENNFFFQNDDLLETGSIWLYLEYIDSKHDDQMG